MEDLHDEQRSIACHILDKIHEWMTLNDLSKFVPLRCTMIGPAGSGKSVLINTITTCIRKLFDYNNVVAVGCPTGTAAFNANGETLHSLTAQGIAENYVPFSISDAKKKMLCEKFKHLLCLIVDERSMLTSKLLGNTSQILYETIFNGTGIDDILGGLPVLVLVGDDYQLPGTGEGALEALYNYGGSKMTQRGRSILLHCAKTVYKLSTVRRINDDRQADKELLQRIREGTAVTDADVARLQALHLDNIRDKHGPDVVAEIQKDALYLFWTNEKRTKHNLERLGQVNSPDNPTAIIRPKTSGTKFGKSINRHFGTELPKASLLCIDAIVSLQGQNFFPSWGLHNGACGNVKEIVFATDKNPNNGDLPEYVVVHFPQYIGPPWDHKEPKVCLECFSSYPKKRRTNQP
jgi:PIF1-like helicase